MKIARLLLMLLMEIQGTMVLAGAVSPKQWPKVRCDTGGAREEIGLLREALADAYPTLPAELQNISKAIVFMISRREKVWTKLVMGWGPEDDADYRYPDRNFYPAGTIKVSFTEKTIAALLLGRELAKSDPLVAKGVRCFSRYLIVHELTHARQYHESPISESLALHRRGSLLNSCKGGLLDEAVLAQAEKKLDYEREAYRTHRQFIVKDALLAFARAVESYEKTHPAEFAQGGRYHLLASEGPCPFVGKLREEAEMSGHGGDFGPIAKLPNEGQAVPPRIVWTLTRLNDRLAGADDPQAEARKAAAAVHEIKEQWASFMSGDNLQRVSKVLPCAAEDMDRRFQLESARFDSFLTPGYAAMEN